MARAYVAGCERPQNCDTPRQLVESSGGSLRFVAGSDETAVESGLATGGPIIPIGDGRGEIEVEAIVRRFVVTAHSRTGRHFAVTGSRRDPSTWSTRCRPADAGACGDEGEWRQLGSQPLV